MGSNPLDYIELPVVPAIGFSYTAAISEERIAILGHTRSGLIIDLWDLREEPQCTQLPAGLIELPLLTERKLAGRVV